MTRPEVGAVAVLRADDFRPRQSRCTILDEALMELETVEAKIDIEKKLSVQLPDDIYVRLTEVRELVAAVERICRQQRPDVGEGEVERVVLSALRSACERDDIALSSRLKDIFP